MQDPAPPIFPKIIHIGVPRSGTTTIQRVLAQDPRVNLCNSRYFQNARWLEGGYETGVVRDRVNVHSDETMVRQAGWNFKLAVTMERIHHAVPDAHIVLTIREQKRWLLSRYRYGVGAGYEHLSFVDWLQTTHGIDFMSIGYYATLYRVVVGVIPPEQVHVLCFEDMVKDFKGYFGALYRIIGLPPGELSPLQANPSLSDSLLARKRMLNRTVPGLVANGRHRRLHGALRRTLTRAARLLEVLGRADRGAENAIRWGDSAFFSGLEREYRRTNRDLQNLTGVDLARRGYLV